MLIPFLTAKGIKQLDALILTHADQDHIGEAETLLKHHKVKRLVIPKGFVSEPKDEKVLQTAREEGVTIEEVKRGDVLQIKDLQFHVLSPEAPDPASKNNSSLVLWMETGVLSWILTGDLEKEGEQEVMDVFPNIKADVLKVGHHGSKGSTYEEFIQQLQPKTVIISMGKTIGTIILIKKFCNYYRDILSACCEQIKTERSNIDTKTELEPFLSILHMIHQI